MGWDLLGVERLVASPVPTGTGRIRIAHGEFSVPAPATAELLRGVPLAESAIPHELTTPTGAAIVATLADGFGPLPAMTIERIGYGAGQPRPAAATQRLAAAAGRSGRRRPTPTDQVCVLETNLDDASGELIGYCIERLWEAGALDVYTTAIQMKKNRPGVKLSVLCRPADAEAMEAILFGETTTLGVRRWPAGRRVLPRQPHQVETPWGPVEGKSAGWPSADSRASPPSSSRAAASPRNAACRCATCTRRRRRPSESARSNGNHNPVLRGYPSHHAPGRT